MILVSVTLFIN